MKTDENISPAEFKDLAQRAGKVLLEEGLSTPDNVYVELGVLKDLNLGVLQAILHDSGELNDTTLGIIKKNLKEYQTRLFDDYTWIFRELGITQKEADEYLYRTDKADLIYGFSPVTVYPGVIHSDLRINAHHSLVKDKFTKTKVEGEREAYHLKADSLIYYINTYPLVLGKRATNEIGNFFIRQFHVNTVVFCCDPTKLDEKFLAKTDEFVSCDLTRLMGRDPKEPPTAFIKALEKSAMTNKTLKVPPIFSRAAAKELDVTKLKDEMDLIKLRFSVAIQFQWYATELLSVDLSVFEDGKDDLPFDDKIMDIPIPEL